jgi:hypothetical protein
LVLAASQLTGSAAATLRASSHFCSKNHSNASSTSS